MAKVNPYNRAHRRARVAKIHRALGTACPGSYVLGVHYRSPRCTRIMTNPQRMDLDHQRTPVALGGRTSIGDTVVCSACNRGAGARLAAELRRLRLEADYNKMSPTIVTTPRRRSRVW